MSALVMYSANFTGYFIVGNISLKAPKVGSKVQAAWIQDGPKLKQMEG